MARRALTTWISRQQELNRLLLLRHAMLARPEPGRRMLQALGLGPEHSEPDVRPRRLVRVARELEPRPATRTADVRSTNHSAAEQTTQADLAEVQRSDRILHSDVAATAGEFRPVEENETPDVVSEPGEPAAVRDEEVHDLPTRIAEETASTPKPEDEPLVATATASEPAISTVPPSEAPTGRASSDAAADEIKPRLTPANAAPFTEQRQARRPSVAARVAPERASDDPRIHDRADDRQRDAEPPRPGPQHPEQPAAHTAFERATPDTGADKNAATPASVRSPLEWMRLLVEATSEPASIAPGAARVPTTRPTVRHADAPRAASPAPVGSAGGKPRIAPAVVNERAKRDTASAALTSAAPHVLPNPAPSSTPPAPIAQAPLSTLAKPQPQVTETERARGETTTAADVAIAPPQSAMMTPAHAAESASSQQPPAPPAREIEAETAESTDGTAAARDSAISPASLASSASSASSAASAPSAEPAPAESPPEQEAGAPASLESLPSPISARGNSLSRVLASLPAPAPLAPSTRRFLKPLVGVDPDTVKVHRGPMAAALAARRNADALTVGDEIVLADAHGETTPSTLGVLAHELTHVARVREPRFVPPIARDAGEPTSRPAVQPQLPHAAAPQPAGADDEALALRVEGAVRRAARSDAARGVDAPRLIPESVEPSARPSRRETGTVEQRFSGEPVGPIESVPSMGIGGEGDDHDPSPWGGLPAPWEPLPEALTRMTASPTNGVGAGVESSAVEGPALAASPAIALAAPAPVQAAARDRTLAEQPASGTAASSGGHATGASPAPDIDALARQVYDVLKRRLAAEKRRGG